MIIEDTLIPLILGLGEIEAQHFISKLTDTCHQRNALMAAAVPANCACFVEEYKLL